MVNVNHQQGDNVKTALELVKEHARAALKKRVLEMFAPIGVRSNTVGAEIFRGSL